MKEAIGKFLCEYNYYPYFCELDEDEWEQHKFWTKKIPIKPKERTINAMAAMKRQNVVDKAIPKKCTYRNLKNWLTAKI